MHGANYRSWSANAGTVLILVSPVYFSMEQARTAARLGYASPMTYAADGLRLRCQGGLTCSVETVVLAAFALATMALGLWRLPWRDK